MLNGRAKNGPDLGINWGDHSLSFLSQKHRRKTLRFGEGSKVPLEVYIRELSIHAGLGCALWDASIILARFIYTYRHIFESKAVLELGSGCGLPGILAGMFAKSIIVSDYLEQAVDNLGYNLRINANYEDDLLEITDENERNTRRLWRSRLKEASVQTLDWEKYDSWGRSIEPSDIILGSELTYSLQYICCLSNVIEGCLKPTGIFLEILSSDRDGVTAFCELMDKKGFVHEAVPVEERFLGNYQSNQRPETYSFHAW
eukprot:CAMPEP_0184647800 /NCGR_PEP_ID=MMETSP0308-20130426/4800_1 /TAXON_ID=38269 /ORGANISM="Gloeochaete witrockiana, Strain SAG 46.84" /LENGTH=257 /DNA_ID=CAMNT_0027079083 /DNA_START=94 /DNA_END=864 /DNA_ORIENTATION=-